MISDYIRRQMINTTRDMEVLASILEKDSVAKNLLSVNCGGDDSVFFLRFDALRHAFVSVLENEGVAVDYSDADYCIDGKAAIGNVFFGLNNISFAMIFDETPLLDVIASCYFDKENFLKHYDCIVGVLKRALGGI